MIDPDGPAHEPDGAPPSGSVLSDSVLVMATTVGLVVVAACSVVIAKLLDDVMGADDSAQRDPRMLNWVVDHRTDPLTTFFRAVTHLADPIVVIVVATVATLVLFRSRHRRLALLVAVSTAGTAMITTVAKMAVDRARPPQQLWLGAASGPAFPSGHSAQSVALYGVLAVVVWSLTLSPAVRIGAVVGALLIAVAVGTSRVYLAVHWPSDVLCGWAVAALWLTTLLMIGWSLPQIRTLVLADRAGRSADAPDSRRRR